MDNKEQKLYTNPVLLFSSCHMKSMRMRTIIYYDNDDYDNDDNGKWQIH